MHISHDFTDTKLCATCGTKVDKFEMFSVYKPPHIINYAYRYGMCEDCTEIILFSSDEEVNDMALRAELWMEIQLYKMNIGFTIYDKVRT